MLSVSVAGLDTNGNGDPGLIPATARRFDRRYPPAIYEEGGFTVAMFAPGDVSRAGAEPIHEWLIVDERLQAARGRSAFGECEVAGYCDERPSAIALDGNVLDPSGPVGGPTP